jgi:hypothetical protein
MTRLEQLAAAARPRDFNDWCSGRQIAAQNTFCDALKVVLTAEQFEAFEAFCLKATPDEMIDEGLRLARGTMRAP